MKLNFCLLLLVATLVAAEGIPRSHRPNCKRNLSERKCGNGSLDMIFLIDSSASLKRESFDLSKEVVINFIEDRGVDNTRYAVLQYQAM